VDDLNIRFSVDGNHNPMDLAVVGPRQGGGGKTNIGLDNGKGLSADFLNKIFAKNALGARAEDIIAEDRANI